MPSEWLDADRKASPCQLSCPTNARLASSHPFNFSLYGPLTETPTEVPQREGSRGDNDVVQEKASEHSPVRFECSKLSVTQPCKQIPALYEKNHHTNQWSRLTGCCLVVRAVPSNLPLTSNSFPAPEQASQRRMSRPRERSAAFSLCTAR